MQPRRLTVKFAAGTAACALVLCSALMAAAPARAEDDALDTKLIRGLLEGLGLKRDGEATINYQERAPLVIPPSRDLPPPEKADVVVTNNPAWPKDPDVLRRKEEERLKRSKPGVFASDRVMNEERPLQPNELTPGGNPRTPPSGRKISEGRGADGERLSPSELGYKGGLWSKIFGDKENEAVRFTGEPPRASLTEPPPGYQTPSPDQPYGAGKGPPPKAQDYYTTHVEGR